MYPTRTGEIQKKNPIISGTVKKKIHLKEVKGVGIKSPKKI